ncbi:hypothetical protein F5X68DRAFT_163914 [Plectosphaerella plurivora]|uniref:Transcription factor domain-containing protein n=1 Tax=Plectosphaerella plurivora TaxID=936078 RepID=A0A9P9AF01_9PEZI|nr:hypothetical protein F5X68DRAFT_163914 [Plectosphaerella plurivora]
MTLTPSPNDAHRSDSPRVSQFMEQETLHDAIAKVHVPDRTSRADSTTPSTCPFHKITSDDTLVALVRSYPRLMVRPGIYPPFVHHMLYPCATGEIAEPLAKAFCCVGAFYASLPTSRSFVCGMMNEESGRLVKSFTRDSLSDGEMLAIVHAMCVYQMIGFFGGGDKDDVKAAGMRHSFFLKNHLEEEPLEEVGEVAWRRWIMSETIRRTVLLVNAINILSCRVEKQERLFFEPLDAQLVRGMLLPAPDALWQASTAEEWAAARRSVGGGITLQQALDQIGANGHLDPPFGGLEQLDAFVQLVIFTAGIEKEL